MKEPENPYEEIEIADYSHNRCSDSWEDSDEENDDYVEMIQDTAEYITEKNTKETEHIKLISYESKDVFTHTSLMEHIV